MITVKLWKEVTAFEPIVEDKLDVDGTVDIIAKIEGKTKEEIEEIPMSDLLPTYLACVRKVNAEVFKKVENLPKNGSGDSN